MTKQQLASRIWKSANEMRSKIEANEYKDYILGFIFYKFLSEKEVDVFLKDGGTKEEIKKVLNEGNDSIVKYFQEKIGYFISYKNLFQTWLNDENFNVSNVSDALSAFDRMIHSDYNTKKVYEKIFDTLSKGLSKLGDNPISQTKAINNLINLIKDIPMDDKQGYDVLGFIYEYLISMFAANAGKKGGEFFTPHEVSLLMSEIIAYHLKDRDKIDIYDPTSGSGSLLINIGKTVAKYMKSKDNICYYAQELIENTYGLTRMNLVLRGILPQNIFARNGDTLADDWPYFDENNKESTYKPLFVDAVVSNPPYSQKRDPKGAENDARFKNYGVAPRSKADYAFLLHDLYHLKSDGILTIVLPHGVLFRSGEEETIRRNLIEQNNIDTIIGLPANIFFGTGIPTIIMILKKQRESSDILIIDASKGFEKSGNKNKLRSSDIKKIIDTYKSKATIPNYSRLVTREEIQNNEYNLNIPRYVDSSTKPESWDIYSNIFGGIPNHEIENLSGFWQAFSSLRAEIFDKKDSHTSFIKVENIKEVIENNKDILKFKENYKNKFSDFYDYLKRELIDELDNIDKNNEEAKISDELFTRLNEFALIDKYDAYQALDDVWIGIDNDLEIIALEGKEAIKKVDPNMVEKTKNGKKVEVQDGYVGHILPFDLIQNEFLANDLLEIETLNNKIDEIESNLSNLFDEVPEDNRVDQCINTEENKFINDEIKKRSKELKKQKEDEYTDFDRIVIQVQKLNDEKKILNKELKIKNSALIETTKAIIENLNDTKALELLEHKWIIPIVETINNLPNLLIKKLVTLVTHLNKKYEDTLINIDDEIRKVERELSIMLDDLDADEFDLKGLSEFKKMLGGKN